MLSDQAAMEHLATRIVAEGLSVRATEEIVSVGEQGTKRAPRSRRPVELSSAADELQRVLTNASTPESWSVKDAARAGS